MILTIILPFTCLPHSKGIYPIGNTNSPVATDASMKALHRINLALPLQVGLTVHEVVWEKFALSDLPRFSQKKLSRVVFNWLSGMGWPFLFLQSHLIQNMFSSFFNKQNKNTMDNNLLNYKTMIIPQCWSKGHTKFYQT